MTDASQESDGAWTNLRYEEQLEMRGGELLDGVGGGHTAGIATAVVGAFLVGTFLVGSLVLFTSVQGLAGGFASLDAFLDAGGGSLATHPVVLGVIGVAVLVCGYLVVGFVWTAKRQLGRAFAKVVHVRVSDAGVSVSRTGSLSWESAGVDVPFEEITAVELVDPDESSFRVELGDARSEKFIAGRSSDWVRIERSDDPAVYVGSDDPKELAAVIAKGAPGDVTAEPY